MQNIIFNFSNIISNNIYIALAAAFIAGIISSFSPCTLSSLPLLIGYIENNNTKNKKSALMYSVIFSLGLVLTFTTLGIVSAILGKFISGAGKWWYLILGVIMILIGLQMLGFFGKKNDTCKVPKRSKSLIGSFFLGIVGGLMASPCSTPALAAILAFVAEKGNVQLGGLMLFLYSLGHSILIIIAGTSVGVIEHLSSSQKTFKIGNILKNIFSIFILILGLYFIYLGF